MRKIAIMSLVLLFLMPFATMVCAEQTEESADEVKTFDVSAYENAPGYNYDKFDKEWSAYSAYVKEYSDAILVFGLKVAGDEKGTSMPPYIYVWVRKPNNTDCLYKITGIQILANDEVYSAKSILTGEADSDLILSSDEGKKLLEALAQANEISLKYIFSTGAITEEVSQADYAEIKELAQILIKNDPWSFINEDSSYGLDKDGWDSLIHSKWPIEN